MLAGEGLVEFQRPARPTDHSESAWGDNVGLPDLEFLTGLEVQSFGGRGMGWGMNREEGETQMHDKLTVNFFNQSLRPDIVFYNRDREPDQGNLPDYAGDFQLLITGPHPKKSLQRAAEEGRWGR